MPQSVMQQLYESEINVSVSSFYDDGFLVQLGDEVTGFVAEARLPTWADVEKWLACMARIHFPTACSPAGSDRLPCNQEEY